MCNRNDAVERLRREVQMFYVTSKELPTVAIFKRITRAYAFRNLLALKLGYQVTVIKVEEESDV